MPEKRGARRVAFVADVECEQTSWGSVHRSARVADISLGGVFVDSLWAFPVGSAVRLKFTLPTLQMSVLADVVNAFPPHGMGLRFRDLSGAQRLAVEALMEPESSAHPLEALLESAELGGFPLVGSPHAEEETREIPAAPVQAAAESVDVTIVEEEAGEPEPVKATDESAAPPEEPFESMQRELLAEVGAAPDAAPKLDEAPKPDRTPRVDAAAGAAAAVPKANGASRSSPAPRPGPSPKPPGTRAAVDEEPSRKRVLVIDDHERTRAMLRGMIEGRDNRFEVVEATDGQHGVEVVRESPPFDLIFLDVEMPNLDGLGACRKLREMGVQTPIVFLTGRDGLDDFRAGREAGADTYIKKPIILGTLRSMLGLFTSGSVARR